MSGIFEPALLLPPRAEETWEGWRAALELLHRMERPAAVARMLWLLLCRDAERFMRGPWAEGALAVGWRTRHLFMCHRDCPVERFDCRGLVWAIGGGEVVGVARDAAMIRPPGQARPLREPRRSPPEGVPIVMAWELPPALPLEASDGA